MSATTRRSAVSDSRVGFGEIVSVSATLGALTGCLFGTVDILLHSYRPVPTDLLFAFALAGVLGALLLLVLTFPMAAAFRVLGRRLSRLDWIALLAGLSVIALTAATLTLARAPVQNVRGFALVLLGGFGAIIAGAVVSNLRPLQQSGTAILWAGSSILALVTILPGTLALVSREFHLLTVIFPVAMGIALAVALVQYRSERHIMGKLGLIALAIGVMATLVWLFADPVPPRLDGRARESGNPPNVILIVLDTTRADHLGAYGGRKDLTPVLDRFAEESVVYEDAFSTSHWTVPSHASMFTGLHPVSHGCSRLDALHLDDKFETLAERLKEFSYDTAAFYSNIWLEQTNQLQGFDAKESIGRRYIGLWLLPFAETLGLPSRWIDKGGSIVGPEIARWLNRDRSPGKPFFLFINLLEAHALYLPPREYRERFLPPDVGYLKASLFAKDFEPARWHLSGRDSTEAEKVVRGLYAAEVSYQDEVLGRILEVLDESTDPEENLIIITADHGENLFDSGQAGHEFAVNDILIHIPLIVKYPGSSSATGRISGLCQLTDLVPTVFDVIGREASLPSVGGRSLRPEAFRARDMIAAQGAPEFSSLSHALSRGDLSQAAFRRFAADKRVYRTADYKYVWSSDGRHELYSLAEDPLETTNVIEGHPEVALELNARLSDWWAEQPAYKGDASDFSRPQPMSEDVFEQLRALGYVE